MSETFLLMKLLLQFDHEKDVLLKVLEMRFNSYSFDYVTDALRDEDVNIFCNNDGNNNPDSFLQKFKTLPIVDIKRAIQKLDPRRVPVVDRPFMTVPTEQERQQLVKNFISATGKRAVSQVTCCICGRKIFEHEAQQIKPEDIPHPELLAPKKSHPGHELTLHMLLYRERDSKKVPPFGCQQCLASLNHKIPKTPAIALANNMWIGDVPFELQNLTLCERILISRYLATAYIVKLYPKDGTRNENQLYSALRGNVSSYFLNTEKVAAFLDPGYLPPNPKILSATIGVTFIGRRKIPLKYLPKYLSVDHRKLLNALKWLIANNPLYKGIKISEKHLAALPEGAVPLEVQNNIRWLPDETVLIEEHNGYVPDADGDECESSDGGEIDNTQMVPEDSFEFEDGNSEISCNEATVEHNHLQSLGMIDVNRVTIPQSEIIANALLNASGKNNNEHLWIKPGGFVNTYGRKNPDNKPTWGTTEDTNHLLGCFPHLFPYGEGGLETERQVAVSYLSHVRWALQYADDHF
ncbi:hypothetical protein GYMLUDRAFT_249635 [Collybiopsis luxurians FD-317 M1]|uniref:DUF6570 domain-containing protein n=1 Tax=Collybiopsis luxurians FD-317 M1 TaxID=944289 RepID=A0A0D0CH84_9AGAR|nr:hypothetical protein GYMLUDRAFT_249635 [Collybiopsis luxurians FD-317 M1]